MNNKDRSVRINSLPLREVIYTFYKRKYKNMGLRLVVLIVLLLSNIELMFKLAAIFVFLYFILSNPKELIMEVSKETLVYYLNNDYAILIYNDEILSFQSSKEDKQIVVNIIMKNMDEYTFKIYDEKDLLFLNEALGSKNALKR